MMTQKQKEPEKPMGSMPGDELTQIENLVGWGKGKKQIAEDLGISGEIIDSLLKRAGEPGFRKLQDRVTRRVTEDSLKAGKSTTEVTQQLHIGPSALTQRLRRVGTSVKEIQEQAVSESLTEISANIEELFKAWEEDKVPQSFQERWAERGDAQLMESYRQVFSDLMEGKQPASKSKEYDSMRAVVLPEVRERMNQVLGLLEKPGVSDQEKKAFELIAVENMTENEAKVSLSVSESRVSQIRAALAGKLPALGKFFTQPRFSEQAKRRRQEKADATAKAKRESAVKLDTYLSTNGPKELSGSIKKRALRHPRPLELAGAIVGALKDAIPEMGRVKFWKRYEGIALRAIIEYQKFSDEPLKAFGDLKGIADTTNTVMDELSIPKRYRRTIYREVAQPKYAGKPDAVRARIVEVKGIRDTVERELGRIGAPRECWGRISSRMMRVKKPEDVILERTREYAETYKRVKESILAEGHPQIVAEYVGVGALMYKKPLEGWRNEVKAALGREHKKHVESNEYVKETGLDDQGFLKLLNESRGGDASTGETLLDNFDFLARRSEGTTRWKDTWPAKNRAILAGLIQTLPKTQFEQNPLAEFTTYASYLIRISDRRRGGMEKVDDFMEAEFGESEV